MPRDACLRDVQQGVGSCWDSRVIVEIVSCYRQGNVGYKRRDSLSRDGVINKKKRVGYQPGHTVQESSRSGRVGVDAAAGVLLPRLAQDKQLRERKLIWTIDEAEIPRQRGMAARLVHRAAEVSVAPKSRQILNTAAGPRTPGLEEDDKRRAGYYLTYHW